MPGKLFLVPTPVGNLEDITLRAIRILKEVDFILAEDTRTSRVLLNHHGIDKQVRAYHQHNEHQVVEDIVNRILSGNVVALVTDAGTPGISDPGFLSVRACIKAGLMVETLPGPTAFGCGATFSTSLRCHRSSVSGVTSVAMSASSARPIGLAALASAIRSSFVKEIRPPIRFLAMWSSVRR